MSAFAPGGRLQDRFTLVERIGAGGMSEVWRATDELLGRPVAVKVLVSALPEADRLTWREARAAARLTHPNVTQVYDYGELPLPGGGSAGYLVMELVSGQTLASRLSAGPLPWRQAARVARQVAAALAAAHRQGVVHRDIKPGNVVLTRDGLTGDAVKVLDFGIAAVAGGDDSDPGRLLGTPEYAAPERLDVTAPARPASDVYSLGVLLYEALAGHPPDRSPPPPVPGVPEPMMRLCDACLAPDPARRPDAGQVAAGLAEAVGEPVTAAVAVAPRVDPTRTLPLAQAAAAPRRGRGWMVPLAGAALAAIVLGLVLLAAALPSGDPDSGPPRAGDPGTGSPTAPAPSLAPESPAGRDRDPDPSPEVVTALTVVIDDAFDAGAITEDAREELGDEVDDLAEAFEEDPDKRGREVGKAAADLRKEIRELRDDGEIDQATADSLNALLVGPA